MEKAGAAFVISVSLFFMFSELVCIRICLFYVLFPERGGRAPAGGTVGAKSKPSDQSWDGGRKKLATDGDLMTLLAGRQRRLREAEDADAGLYFQQ